MEKSKQIRYTVNSFAEYEEFIKDTKNLLFEREYIMKEFFVYEKSIVIMWTSAFDINESVLLTFLLDIDKTPILYLDKVEAIVRVLVKFNIRHTLPNFYIEDFKCNETPDLMN